MIRLIGNRHKIPVSDIAFRPAFLFVKQGFPAQAAYCVPDTPFLFLRQVMLFPAVIPHIVQFFIPAVVMENIFIPVIPAHHPAPVSQAGRRKLEFPIVLLRQPEKGFSPQLPVRISKSTDIQTGGQQIEAIHKASDFSSSRKPLWITQKQRHAHRAFISQFFTVIPLILQHFPMIGGENDKRIIKKPFFPQSVQNLSHRHIHHAHSRIIGFPYRFLLFPAVPIPEPGIRLIAVHRHPGTGNRLRNHSLPVQAVQLFRNIPGRMRLNEPAHEEERLLSVFFQPLYASVSHPHGPVILKLLNRILRYMIQKRPDPMLVLDIPKPFLLQILQVLIILPSFGQLLHQVHFPEAMMLPCRKKMHFPYRRRPVAVLAENTGKGGRGIIIDGLFFQIGIIAMIPARTPCKQIMPACHTYRVRGMALFKKNPFPGQPIQIRGMHMGKACRPDSIIPLLIRKKQQHIRPFLRFFFHPVLLFISFAAAHPLTAPIITPFSKYFCTKG